jgi:hypothetical protein
VHEFQELENFRKYQTSQGKIPQDVLMKMSEVPLYL